MAYTTINKSTDYFNTKLYTGNATARTIDVGFQPDLVWGKLRSTTGNHWLWDSIRGANYYLKSNATDANNTGGVQDLNGFVSNGFTVGTGTRMNTNSGTMASWNWKANGAGSANTAGSISSTVSASTTSGFSIVSYTGTGSAGTIGHGLGVAPACIIIKTTSTTSDWFVYHQSTGATNRTKLNQTVASATSTFINNTAPSSTVFNTEGGGASGTNGETYIAYCFAEKQGYSKFGSYTGNGNADGTFVYTGFKPAFVIFKSTNVALSHWYMWDSKRNTYNQINKRLYPNLNNSEGDGSDNNLDFLSNGFKMRTTNTDSNGNGSTYIYMAFAEEPLVGDNPATAR